MMPERDAKAAKNGEIHGESNVLSTDQRLKNN